MYKNMWRTCRVIVLLILTYCFFAVFFIDVAVIIAWTPYHSPDHSQSVEYRGSKNNNKFILHLFLDHNSLIKDK